MQSKCKSLPPIYEFIRIEKAPVSDKHKFIAVFRHKETSRIKKTPFGARGYSDYTIHKDSERRDRYITRHKKDLRTCDPTRAGFLSYYILWGSSTQLQKNVKEYRRLFFP